MLFDSTKLLLRSIVHSLEQGDEAAWEDHQQSAMQCLYELHQTARSASRNYRPDSNPKYKTVAPSTVGALQAIPQVKLMAGAIRRKDRPAAVEAGRAAMADLDCTHSRLRAPIAPPPPEHEKAAAPTVEPPSPAGRRKKSAGAKRATVAKPRPKPRTAAASSR